MTATKAQLDQRVRDLEEIHRADTTQIDALTAAIATRDEKIVVLNRLNQVIVDCETHIAVLKDFIETQDETHADEMSLLNHLNETVNERLNQEVAARQERMTRGDGLTDSMQASEVQVDQSRLMSRVRLLVAAQAYDILGGYGVYYREIAQSVDDCIETLQGHTQRDPKERVIKALQIIKSTCHTLADSIVLCREGGIHENFKALWPGSLESVEAPKGSQGSIGTSARYKVE